MGRLRLEGDARSIALSPRHLVGRSAACALVLRHAQVSSEHAVIAWDGAGWRLRELASRNGTTVDGVAVAGGAEVALRRGARIVFAGVSTATLEDDLAPVASATSAELTRLGAADVLSLPDDDVPAATVLRDVDGLWWLERGLSDAPEQVHDGDTVWVEERAWTLSLPTPPGATQGLASPPALTFFVSLDEERVGLEVACAGRTVTCPPRSHNYLLLTLARQRLAEAAAPVSERGWWSRDDLARALRCDPKTVNVQLHRLRGDLGRHALVGVTGLLEVRARTGQVRVGTDQIHIRRG